MALPVLLTGMRTVTGQGVKVEVLDAAAVGFSLGRRDYFTVNAIVALLSLGEYLEKLSDNKATGLLKNLLQPNAQAIRVDRAGREFLLNQDELIIGDKVICGSGEMIPVDGLVLEGQASVNQSSITGEAVPVHLQPEEEVLSGSVVEEGRIVIQARQVGSETSMARINRFLENSMRFQSKSQKQSDKLADQLVPATFGLGLALFFLTRDVRRAAAVLTVDYSCALKLSNPVAVKAAMYKAAHKGVLLKGSQALDALARVDTLVFDKTGTLTRGILEVTDVIPAQNMSADELLALAAAAEEHYAHPLARAVVSHASEQGLELPLAREVDFIVAHGVSAYVSGQRILVGSHHFIAEDEAIDCSSALDPAQSLRQEGKSLLYVAREGKFEGLIALRDALRPEAARALKELKSLGITKTIMLTGDHADTAQAVAQDLAWLDEVHWELKPEQKAIIVQELQENGGFSAFAGDGVNDAPALMAAEVGICMPDAADLARETAQVVLLQQNLCSLVTARRIALQTQGIIKNCFKSSVGLNSLFLLLAGSGRISPVMAAVLHNVSTVGTLGYAALSAMNDTKKIKESSYEPSIKLGP
jgi:Cu2+-exporting ATPase